MPLNKLENFIKNAEGRILYVNPNDLDSTDGIENQGNSLTKPFKTIQRALLESARFSYLRGDDNDITEKTTILVFPGEHLIDNRPGFAIKDNGGVATAVSPGGAEFAAQNELTLTLNSNFDLTQEDNILYKFNSINGGIIIPRGTSIVGLDLRKTKVRPKYVPNPTDADAPSSAIFRVTGACYFWQFTFFDGDETGVVYTDPRDFSTNNRSKPTFSHHKLTCFEYADGVNIPGGYQLTDLDMYYSKIGNAFNRASGREIDQKFPAQSGAFSKQRPEWEIVGAFASDPVVISEIISGDGATPGTIVTVTTQTPHDLNSGTPIKIQNINVSDYNISTKVVDVLSETRFTYALPSVRANLPAGPGAGLAPGNGAAVVIETDTVSGASPYIFNVSLRSVYGMAGMHADGSKADGFRSMVVAQFTAVSLQKDDRAFVKYYPSNRTYDGISYNKVTGEALASGSSSTNNQTVFHLDSDAIYRDGWKTTHIKMSNDAVIQVVSVFAIGFHKHFECLSGGDASITNSNSNFGQFSLASDGFKTEAFGKDDKGYVTGFVTPRSIATPEVDIEWVQFDADLVTNTSDSQRLYLLGYSNLDIEPPIISQGYRIGAKSDERVYLVETVGGTAVEHGARILMTNDIPTGTGADNAISGTDDATKLYTNVVISTPPTDQTGTITIYNTVNSHNLRNGETVRVFSETGDLPEGLDENRVYYAVTSFKNSTRTDGVTLTGSQFQLASSRTNADAAQPLYITSYGGEELKVESRVSDKSAGEIGHPIQYDYDIGNWFVYVEANSALYTYLQGETGDSEISIVKRVEDGRSLDEKIYKLRYVVPKELINARDPVSGFILQESSTVNVRENSDFNLSAITTADYDFDRNPKFISTCTYNNATNTIVYSTDLPHNLKDNDIVVIEGVTSTTNEAGTENFGFNGSFTVVDVKDSNTFTVGDVDIFDITHAPGISNFDANTRNKTLPTLKRNDAQANLYIYRVEVITPYVKDVQDGVYYLYVLNANNAIQDPSGEFAENKYSQNITDLYPQLDRDNFDDNPPAAVSYAKRTPLGEVVTNDLKRSLTRESADKFSKTFNVGKEITSLTSTNTSATLTFEGQHGLSGITTFTTLNGGSGHTDGTYSNVRLINNSTLAPTNLEVLNLVWDGALARVTVSGGAVTNAVITSPGSGYLNGETLFFDANQIGGVPQASLTITTDDINDATTDYVQITGIGTTGGGYYKISSVGAANQITIARTAGDPLPVPGEYATVIGRVGTISNHSVSSVNNNSNTFTITSGEGSGLTAGNSITLLDASNNNLGEYYLNSVTKGSTNTFNINTSANISSATQFLKHGFSANNASADSFGENIGTRSLTFYDNNVLITTTAINVSVSQFRVQRPGGSTAKIESRFPVGSYIQIDNEIMRVKSSELVGTNNDELQVIRGSMGTIIESHEQNSEIKKINLLPIEARRPSILRASGHTFEYLGYGPGNYSTGLPQVQLKTLSEDEEFLSQSQETACGTVLYTGMDSDGDFYIGNTKYAAQSGEQKTFDVPTPTVTGEDPNRLSVVFDEVIVKERILVEGGKSKQILSQFDGPVTFTGTVRLAETLILNGVPSSLRTAGSVDIKSQVDALNCTDQNAALRVAGGVAIGKRLFVCDDIDTNGGLDVTGITTLRSTVTVMGLATFNTGIVPDTDEGAYIGTSDKPWARALIGEIRIANSSNDNEIDTATGGLTLDSNSGTTTVDDNLVVTGTLDVDGFTQLDGLNVDGTTTLNNTTVDGVLDVNGSATIDNVTINGSTVTATTFSGQATDADQVRTKSRSTNASHYLTFVTSNTSSYSNKTLFTDGGIYYNPNSNRLYVANDIYAFVSDDRLKSNKVGITGALDKVNSLNGFTYEFSDAAIELGYNNDGRMVGVSAQEVEAVLPEAVGSAAINEGKDTDYKTVQYEKLTALLIEAVKELSEKVSALEEKLNN